MISHLHPCQTQPSRLYQTHIVTLCDILANIHLTFDLAFHLTHFLPYPDDLSDICPSTVLKIHHGREASTVIHITPFSAHLTAVFWYCRRITPLAITRSNKPPFLETRLLSFLRHSLCETSKLQENQAA